MGGIVLLIRLTCTCSNICIIASETLAFAQLLTLLIVDLVPEDNEHWSLYLILLQITEIVMAP